MSGPRGLFIVFEGGDGSGKSTHTGLLTQWLTDQGYIVRTTFEPGDTALGAQIRQIVLHSELPLSPRTEALLYAADKSQHIAEVVDPALAAGQIVVCDRYVDSTIAYQGAGRLLDLAEVSQLAWWATEQRRPDLTVVMDVPVVEAFAGMERLDRMEAAGVEFHERVRGHFLDLAAAEPERYLVVHGRSVKAEVAQQIRQRVQLLLADDAYQLARRG